MNGRCLRAALVLLLLSLKALADAPVVSIAFVGDIMLDDTPGKVIRQGRDPFAPFAAILRAADYRIGNLECVVARGGTREPRKPYTFRAHPRVLPFLSRHFDAVSLANNHSGDYGSAAFAEMLGRLEKAGVAYFGGGHTLAEAHAPLLVDRNGLRIALLGYNEFFPRSFEADFDKPGIAWSEDEQVILDIRQARSEHRADLVIPVMHWGWEHEPLASERQRRLARLMIDAGADAVVGGHPHVTQDVETYRGKPIVYSLGNFVFDGFDDEASNTGWLLRMALDKSGVVSWQTFVAHLDKEGIPRPAKGKDGQCWLRGMTEAGICPVQ
ncbi:MAG: poly-gamma-glutamate biosynthesis protein [Betaproteobacteria bacterium HGW-Betaproteobacteria-7]|jgi:poly-gamma-glutamate synthesis protein (capsule biosynthesis protein)|nr:MAG: poly-gamma-glutamate biosynthesis protein [Betaproteobacteria bacterium HGW-Betaproteobacteria-7]